MEEEVSLSKADSVLTPADDPYVTRVSTAPASPESLLLGVALGALASFLALLSLDLGPGDILRGFVPAASFIGLWTVAAWFLTRETGRVLVVLRRGFFLGALQWALLTVLTPKAAGDLIEGVLPWVLLGICVVGSATCWAFSRSPYAELGSDRL